MDSFLPLQNRFKTCVAIEDILTEIAPGFVGNEEK